MSEGAPALAQSTATVLPERVSRAEAAQFWRAGYLGYKLHGLQQTMRRAYYDARKKGVALQVWNIARRGGKSFAELIIGFEVCLANRGGRFPFAAQTGKEVESLIHPMVDEILRDCPKSLIPRTRWSAGFIEFRNDARLPVAGCDKENYKLLRGTFANGFAVDEAAYIGQLRAVLDVLRPQLWTTRGSGIVASNPSDTPAHHFQHLFLKAKARGEAACWTFFDNPMFTEARREEIITEEAQQAGLEVVEFKETSAFQREYMAEFVTETNRAILPEYTEARERKLAHAAEAHELWVDRYTVMDTGGGKKDWTAILYGYWSFARGKFVILRDRILRQPSTAQIAAALLEDEVGTDAKPGCFPATHDADGKRIAAPGMPGTSHWRWMDGSEILMRDLAAGSKEAGLPTYHFVQTAKHDLDSAVKGARDWLVQERVELDPVGCRQLSAQMRAGVWNKQRTKFEYVEGFGHFDLVATYVYAVRNVLPNINRLPKHYGLNPENVFIRDREEPTKRERALSSMFR